MNLCGCEKNNNIAQIFNKNEIKNQYLEDLLSIERSISNGKGQGNIKEKYEFGKKLGEGYYGEVYLGRNKITNEKVAIKILKKKNKSLNKEIIKQIELLKILNHQNIMNINEFYEGKNNVYFITEYYKNGNLLNYCFRHSKQITESIISILLFQILSAINYCHKQKIIHRDLKLENIMISDKTISDFPFIKIIDFTTGKFIESEYENDIIEIPYYIAPEIFDNKITFKSDIWSIGIILYYLITKEQLFDGKDNAKLSYDIKNKEIDLNLIQFRNSSFEIKDLLVKLLKKNPNERINAEDALNHAFFNKYKTKNKLSQLSFEEIHKLLNNVKQFKSKNNLEQITLAYLVNKNSNEYIIKIASCLFLKLDKDNNGIIDTNEFVTGIKKLFQEDGKEISEKELIELFNIIDTDKSCSIEYIEFIRACIDKNEFINEKILQDIFSNFEKDKNGKITLDDLVNVFGFKALYHEFYNIIKECGLDETNSIDYNQFLLIMKKIVF